MPIENANFIVEDICEQRSMRDVKRELGALHGVSSVSVDSAHNLVSVDYNSSCTSYDEIESRLNKMGFQIAADASVINTR